MKIDSIDRGISDIIKDTSFETQKEWSESFEEMLEQAKNKRDDKRLKEACRELESVFINMVFKRMRATVDRGGLIKESYGERLFQSMLDEEFARKASKGQGLGIADMLYQQLSGNKNK